MKVKFGSLVVEGVGKLGGHQFQRGRDCVHLVTKRSGAAKRNRVSTPQNRLVARIASVWQSLSPQTRRQWEQLNFPPNYKPGYTPRSATLNGWSAFLQINIGRVLYNIPMITDNFAQDILYNWGNGSSTRIASIRPGNVKIYLKGEEENMHGISVTPIVRPYIAEIKKGSRLPNRKKHKIARGMITVESENSVVIQIADNDFLKNVQDWYGMSVGFHNIEGYGWDDDISYRRGYNNGDDAMVFK